MRGSSRCISLTAARTRFHARSPSRLPFSSMVSAHSALIQGHDGTVLLQQPELFAGRLSFSRIGEVFFGRKVAPSNEYYCEKVVTLRTPRCREQRA